MSVSEVLKPEVRRQVMRQLDANATWKNNDTRRSVKERAIEEYYELIEEIELDRNIAFLVASEIGDIFYLALKYYEMGGEPDADLDFAVEEALEICELTGLDPNHCCLMKCLRNDFKYAPLIQNNGFNLEEATQLSKALYAEIVGDAAFSHGWLMFGEDISHDDEPEKTEA